MPGHTIHIAIAYEYMRKHNDEIKNEKEFIDGCIAPDLVKNKYESHYGNYAEKHEDLKKFVNKTEIDLKSDFGKGYFLHLIADELFYNNVFLIETL